VQTIARINASRHNRAFKHFTYDITSKSSSPRRAERNRAGSNRSRSAPAPLSSNYRSNGASRYGDPTPASICRLALIQLPRRQLPRWYTCGRFIASVMPVRLFTSSFSRSFHSISCSVLFTVLSLSLSLLLSTFLLLSHTFYLTAIIVFLFDAADARSFRVPLLTIHSRWRKKVKIVGDCVLLHCANSHDGAGDSL